MGDYSYVFVGRVLPERTWVTINNGKPVEFTLRQQDWNLDCKVMISIDVAQVSCTVTSQTQIKDLATLKNVVSDLVSLEVDAFGYLEGRGYTTEIVSLTLPDGHQGVFGVEVGALQQDKGKRPVQFEPLLLKVLLNAPSDTPEQGFHRQSLRYALADMREAILRPRDTPFLCNRAVEAVMQGFKQPQGVGTDVSKAWEDLRAALRIDESPLKALAKDAQSHRHGYHPTVTGGQRVSTMQFTWYIIDRFALYIHRGFTPLPAIGCPLVTMS